jgi:hypothetical protein
MVSVALVGATLLGVRAFDASKFPDLQPWHKYVPQSCRAPNSRGRAG